MKQGTNLHVYTWSRLGGFAPARPQCSAFTSNYPVSGTVSLVREVKTITVCHHEFRRDRKPDFAEEESVGLLKALRRGRRD